MPELIVYQYAMSPFSEKIRAMLGYSQLPWYAVTVKAMPPRKTLAYLIGDYRKIPVAQIGADLFCDTRTITREIARLTGKPELALDNVPEAVQAFVREVDLNIFLACVTYASDGRMLLKLARETSLLDTARFLKDRIGMMRKAKVKPINGKQAKAIVQAHVANLESMLTQPFLFGDTPCIADFSTYHGLWFVCTLAGKPILQKSPNVQQWLNRMQSFGHGNFTALSEQAALDVARQGQPRPLTRTADAHPLLGKSVEIAPDDYGREPVTGKLLFADAQEWIVSRQSADIGEVHVHLPKAGFVVREA